MPLLRLRHLAVLAVLVTSAAAAQPTIIKPEAPSPAAPSRAEPKQVTLPAQKFVSISGHADFDNVYGAVVDGLKKVRAYLAKEGITPAGPPIARYSDGGDSGFQFETGYPVAEAPKGAPDGGVGVGDAPSGTFLDFVHRGSFNNIDETYSAIDDYFSARGRQSGRGPEGDDDKDVLADSFEQYTTDPVGTGPDQVEVHILVPAK